MLLDDQYPIEKFFHGDVRVSKEEFFKRPLTEGVKKKLLKNLTRSARQIEALAFHDMFRQLCGNPMVIRTQACCCQYQY